MPRFHICRVLRSRNLVPVLAIVTSSALIMLSVSQLRSLEPCDHVTRAGQDSRDVCYLLKDSISDETIYSKSDVVALLTKTNEDLRQAARSARSSEVFNGIQTAVGTISNILRNLKYNAPAGKSAQVADKSVPRETEVCPEKFTDGLHGYPFFYEGFVTLNCTNAKPMASLVTIILHFSQGSGTRTLGYLKNVLKGIQKHYPHTTVLIPTSEKFEPKLGQFLLNVSFVNHPSKSSAGEVLNSMVKKVRTRYVLIARDLTQFTADSRLERLVRVAGSVDVSVVGGAVRTSNGHWSKPCQQFVYKNYTLVYRHGYDMSEQECLYCDYIPGPFLAKSKVLEVLKFSDEVHVDTIFEDLFLRVHRIPNLRSVVCPDSLFHVLNDPSSKNSKDTWLSLANEWKLDRIRLASGELVELTCSQSKTGCLKQKGIGLSPCCLQTLANAIKFVMATCEEEGIICELQEGTLLGAVKFNKVLPWERDADITFLSANYSALKKLRPKFFKEGYVLTDLGSLWCCADGRQAGGKFLIQAGSWTLELYGQHLMDSEMLLSRGEQPTRVLFDGAWVRVPRNPGLYARNRYGHECYQHAQHWITMGRKSGWVNYDTSRFSRCPVPGHSGCLDQYLTDGNLQFEDPVL